MPEADTMESIDPLEQTPEDLQAIEDAKTNRALLLTQAMHQQEAQLPGQLPTTPPPFPMMTPRIADPARSGMMQIPGPGIPLAPPTAVQSAPILSPGVPLAPTPPVQSTPLGPPSPTAGFERALIDDETRMNRLRETDMIRPTSPDIYGRMYMGGALTPEQEQEFKQSGKGTRINLMPPSGPRMSQLEQARAADRPGTRTISIDTSPASITSSDPTAKRFAIMQGMQVDKAKGMSDSDISNKWLPLLMEIGIAPAKPFEYKGMHIGGTGYSFDKRTGKYTKETEPTTVTAPPRATTAVNNTHKSLLADEQRAKQESDPIRIKQAAAERQAFENNHPELGLTPNQPASALGKPDETTAYPSVPTVISQRKKGQTYSTSKGNFTWTGTGWKRAATEGK